ISCSEYEEPGLINNPDKTYPANPVITSIEPADAAVAGVREITINGQNFAEGNASNWVFFGTQNAIIKSVSPNKIVVYRPTNAGNSLTVKVVNPDALGFSRIDGYDIEVPVVQFGDYSRYNYNLTAVEADNQEYLYVASRRIIYRVPPDGIEIEELARLGSTFAEITDLKFG